MAGDAVYMITCYSCGRIFAQDSSETENCPCKGGNSYVFSESKSGGLEKGDWVCTKDRDPNVSDERGHIHGFADNGQTVIVNWGMGRGRHKAVDLVLERKERKSGPVPQE